MNNHTFSLIVLLSCDILSRGITYNIYYKKEYIRWFFVHAIVNLLITVHTTHSLFATLSNPLESLNPFLHKGETEFPMCLALWLHFYHIVCYKLSKEDIFHHALFCSLLTLPGYYYEWGVLGNFGLFFICGLPGGLIYLLLFLQKIGFLVYIREPVFSAYINTFVRAPGILIANFIILISLLRGSVYHSPLWAMLIQLIFGPFNAIYYANQSIKRANRYVKS
jgi:hypothetical protein